MHLSVPIPVPASNGASVPLLTMECVQPLSACIISPAHTPPDGPTPRCLHTLHSTAHTENVCCHRTAIARRHGASPASSESDAVARNTAGLDGIFAEITGGGGRGARPSPRT